MLSRWEDSTHTHTHKDRERERILKVVMPRFYSFARQSAKWCFRGWILIVLCNSCISSHLLYLSVCYCALSPPKCALHYFTHSVDFSVFSLHPSSLRPACTGNNNNNNNKNGWILTESSSELQQPSPFIQLFIVVISHALYAIRPVKGTRSSKGGWKQRLECASIVVWSMILKRGVTTNLTHSFRISTTVLKLYAAHYWLWRDSHKLNVHNPSSSISAGMIYKQRVSVSPFILFFHHAFPWQVQTVMNSSNKFISAWKKGIWQSEAELQ